MFFGVGSTRLPERTLEVEHINPAVLVDIGARIIALAGKYARHNELQIAHIHSAVAVGIAHRVRTAGHTQPGRGKQHGRQQERCYRTEHTVHHPYSQLIAV